MAMFYSALLGATLPARALKQGLIYFNLCRAKQTLTIATSIGVKDSSSVLAINRIQYRESFTRKVTS